MEVTPIFTYIGGVIHSSTSCELDVNRRLGRSWSAMNSLDEGVWCCRYLCKRTNVRVFRSVVLPFLPYTCETLTMTGELKRRLNSFGTMWLRQILGHRKHVGSSNDLVLREVGWDVTCIVFEHQLRLYRHVARLPAVDRAYWIYSSRDSWG